MNKELLWRLLHLYPFQATKNYFGSTSTNQTDMIDNVVATRTEDEIYKYCHGHFGLTKKHVYLFDDKKSALNIPATLNHMFTETTTSGAVTSYFIIARAWFTLGVITPYRNEDFWFPWPMKVDISPDGIVLEFTILERKIDYYLPSGVELIKTKQNVDEDFVLEELKLNNGIVWTPKDLHKGVKALWKDDTIDALQANYKKSKSSSVETMDSSFTLKKAYPDLYNEIVKGEITKTNFCFLKDKQLYSPRFVVEPKAGKIAFPLFSDSLNLNQNVIEKILKEN